jgi:tripartite-type tricarboxylate transporter receptor subunit TctC
MKSSFLRLAACIAALCAPALGMAQSASSYPDRVVKLVVPFPPGGATDVIARLVAQKMGEAWKQPVVVENKAGATGAVGASFVAKAEPDGYTILMGTASTHSVAPAVNHKLPYRNLEDFTPLSLVATFPNMLVVHPSVPAKNVAELIALLKVNPGKYNYASTGIGGSVHLAAELFKLMTHTDMVHVPYKGSAPALNDLLAGQVQIEFDNMTTVWPHAQAGRLRALGVAGKERSPAAPDVPAIAETVPGFEANSWVGFFGPAGMPEQIAQAIAAQTREALTMPEVAQRLRDLGASPAPSSPAEFAAFVKSDTERWRGVAKAAHISLD